MNDRILYLLIGGLVGFVFGYIVRSLREITTKVEHVEDAVTHPEGHDGGFASNSFVTNMALLLVVIITVYAAFSSQKASDTVADSQNRITVVSECNQEYLGKTVLALNVRGTYSSKSADANRVLQKAQLDYLENVLMPTKGKAELRRALETYVKALRVYTALTATGAKLLAETPFPEPLDLTNCLKHK